MALYVMRDEPAAFPEVATSDAYATKISWCLFLLLKVELWSARTCCAYKTSLRAEWVPAAPRCTSMVVDLC